MKTQITKQIWEQQRYQWAKEKELFETWIAECMRKQAQLDYKFGGYSKAGCYFFEEECAAAIRTAGNFAGVAADEVIVGLARDRKTKFDIGVFNQQSIVVISVSEVLTEKRMNIFVNCMLKGFAMCFPHISQNKKIIGGIIFKSIAENQDTGKNTDLIKLARKNKLLVMQAVGKRKLVTV